VDATKVLSSVSEHVARTRRSATLATVISTTGSAPQSPGAKMAMLHDGISIGTIGGGAVEFELLEVMKGVLETGAPLFHERHLTRDLGMCCGGTMKFFVERLDPSPRMVFFGAGHIAEPSAIVARAAGFEVLVVDDRDEFNSEQRFFDAERLLMDGDEALGRGTLTLGQGDYVVVCTHCHRLDERIVAQALKHPLHYLGVIGSRRKAETLKSRILQKSPGLDLNQVRSPVGLDLGAVEPGEIAVAIVAELIQSRRAHGKQTLGAQSRSIRSQGGQSQKPMREVGPSPMGVVLAAGASSRMGFPKALGRLNGRTVLEAIVLSLREGGCEEVVVVIGSPHGEEIRAALPSLLFAKNQAPEEGMLGSLQVGVRFAESRGSSSVVVALLDQPRVTSQTIAALVHEARKDGAKYVVPTSEGRRGHPFALQLPLDLDAESPQTTLRDVLGRLGSPLEVAVKDLGILADLDTPRDALEQGVRRALTRV
jgi:xanthine dehydrogenase accessory factor